MALDGAFENRKTRRLARALGVQPWAAIGLLETFWRWCRRSAKNGRIDPDQWEDIADFIMWEKPADSLRDLLIGQRFVDEMGGWDWVHDWHHHADNTTRTYLYRRSENFANGADARIPRDGYRDDVETNRPNVETNGQNVEFIAGARPEPEPEPYEQITDVSVSSRRRREEKKENPEVKSSGERTKQTHGLSSFGDDDEKALGENPKKYLTALMAKATGGQADPKLLRDIEMAVMKAGGTIAAFARDVHPRIMRLRDPPQLSFFLHQARQFGETAEQSNAAVDAKVAILASRLELLKTPKVHIDPTPGCGCIRGMLIANGRPQYCVCQAGVNLQQGKRANDAQ